MGCPLAIVVSSHVRKLEWKEALKGAYLLARYYPKGLVLLVNSRPLLERQLRDRDKQLREKERRLKQLRGALQKERTQLQNRTKELRRLRERNRRLEASEQELQRRLQEAEGAGTWEKLKSLANLQTKPPRR